MDVLQADLRALGLRPTRFVRRPAQPPGFEVIRELSRGGQGIVYEAIQRSTGRRVALKVGLARELPGSDENERFQREVRLLASLQHGALPTVYESGSTDGWRWLAMEYVEGVDLAAWAERTRASHRELVRLCARICEGVALAHRHGIVHRDLKPSNILIDGDGEPVVLDFGLAKRFGTEPGAPDLTRQGTFVGSPLWLAPEQLHCPEDVDPRADVYALGRVLYFLLSGAHPYAGDPREPSWLRSVGDRRPLPLRRVAAAPRDPVLEAIVMKAIDGDPARRYRDAHELRADCVAWLEGAETQARPDGPLARVGRIVRRNGRASVALASVGLLLAALGAIWWGGAPARWEGEVRRALELPASPSLAKLWELHLAAPAGVERSVAPVGGSSSGPLRTHGALLARYSAEPRWGRIALPFAGSADHVVRTAPRGDVAIVQIPAAGARAGSFWCGHDPDYDWAPLAGLEGIGEWQLSRDGELLAGRTAEGPWRLWALGPAPGASPPRELAWVRDLAPRELCLAWQAGAGDGGPAVVALTRVAESDWRLLRAVDGGELARLPSLSAVLQGDGGLGLAALDAESRWLAFTTGLSETWLVPLWEPDAAPRRLPGGAARSIEFLAGEILAIDSGVLRLIDLEVDPDPGAALSGEFLFATDNRAIPVWLRGDELVARSAASSIQLLHRGAREPALEWSVPASVLGLHVAGDGQALLSHEADGFLTRWDISQEQGGAILPPWQRVFAEEQGGAGVEPVAGSVFGIAFSPAGERVAVAQRNPPRVRVRALRGAGSGGELELPGSESPNCLAWSPSDPDLLAIGEGELPGRVYLASLGPAEPARPVFYGELGGGVHAVALSPDGRFLLAAGQAGPQGPTGRIRVWRVGEPGAAIRTLEHPEVARFTSLAFGAGGRWLAAGTARSDALQWLEGPLAGELGPRSIPDGQRKTRDLDPLGQGVVSGHYDGTVRYTAPGARESAVFELGSEIFSVAAHPDGSLVAAGAADGRVHLLSFDGQTFALVVSIPFPALDGSAGSRRLFRVRFSPDGRTLVAGGEPGTLPCFLDLESAELRLARNLEWALALQADEPDGAQAARAWAASLLGAPSPAR